MRGSLLAKGKTVEIAYENSVRAVGDQAAVDLGVLDFRYSRDGSQAVVATELGVKVVRGGGFFDFDDAIYNGTTVNQVRWSNASPACLVLVMKRGALVLFDTNMMEVVDEWCVDGVVCCAVGDAASVWGKFGVVAATRDGRMVYVRPFVGEVVVSDGELEEMKKTLSERLHKSFEQFWENGEEKKRVFRRIAPMEVNVELPASVSFRALEWIGDTVFGVAQDGNLYAMGFGRVPNFVESVGTFAPDFTRVFSFVNFSFFLRNERSGKAELYARDGDKLYEVESDKCTLVSGLNRVCGVAGEEPVFLLEDGTVHRGRTLTEQQMEEELREYIAKLKARKQELEKREEALSKRYDALQKSPGFPKLKQTESAISKNLQQFQGQLTDLQQLSARVRGLASSQLKRTPDYLQAIKDLKTLISEILHSRSDYRQIFADDRPSQTVTLPVVEQ